MLVIDRKQTESVVIEHLGEVLIVTVVGLMRHRDGETWHVANRLGFDGPQSFKILRSELVKRENHDA